MSYKEAIAIIALAKAGVITWDEMLAYEAVHRAVREILRANADEFRDVLHGLLDATWLGCRSDNNPVLLAELAEVLSRGIIQPDTPSSRDTVALMTRIGPRSAWLEPQKTAGKITSVEWQQLKEGIADAPYLNALASVQRLQGLHP